MDKIYYDLPRADSYGSISGLKRQTKGKNIDSVRDFLSRQDAYTLHAEVRRRFPRRKTLAFGINDLWQADIVDLSSLASTNDNYRYLLTAIDVLSKVGRARPLKTKSAESVVSAFREMIKDHNIKHLQTDKGSEFLNFKFQKMLADEGIKHYTSQNEDIKAAVVERWHRTLLAKMYRYFTHKNTTRYIDVLQDLIDSYNKSYHTSIKMAPSEVNDQNESDIRDTLLGKVKRSTPRFKVGDTVRISLAKLRIPSKGYKERWSRELFKVNKIHNTIPITYGIEDYSGEKILGKFYSPELQRSIKEVFEIEKVLRTRKGKHGKTEYYVKWQNYPPKFNSWTTDPIKV